MHHLQFPLTPSDTTNPNAFLINSKLSYTPIQLLFELNTLQKEPEKEYTLEEIAIPEIKPRYGFTDDEVYLMAVLLSGSKYVDGDGEYDVDFS